MTAGNAKTTQPEYPLPGTGRSAMVVLMSVTVVGLGPERREEVRRLDQLAFAFGLDDPAQDDSSTTLEWDRVFGATLDDDPELAGMYAVYSLGLTVPDGAHGAGVARVAMAGLTWVGVHPGHRRRGVATALIRHHLHGLHESGGEAVSGLHATEPAIYGRFGYGLATSGLRLRIPRGAALRDVPGAQAVTTRVLTADAQQHHELVAELAGRRPGVVRLSPQLLARTLVDTEQRRARREPLRLVLAERDGQPTGYALLRREMGWDGANYVGTAKVEELVALDPASARALWGLLTDLDLMSSVETPLLAADDPLLHLLVDARSAKPTRADGLWLRLVDVDRALAGRSYACEVDAVIAVTDGQCPWNARRWRLSGGPLGATCSPTTDPAEVGIDVRDLASAYVGGTSLLSLAAAGLAHEHRAGALARLSSALRAGVEAGHAAVF